MQQKMAYVLFFFSPDDFGLKSPVVQKTFQAKTATSVVARVTLRLSPPSRD